MFTGVPKTKIGEIENKISDTSSLMATAFPTKIKIKKLRIKFLMLVI